MFEWDESKKEKVLAEHKVDFAKITDIFDDPFAVYIEDFEHSTSQEIRFNIIGQTVYYDLTFMVFTYEGESQIRFVKARRAENLMIQEYEKNRKRL